ncbi:G patch domain and ankyrin repeat-containing protein 1 homolog [Dendrobium catenatum]|uniref:SURP and G-patch domain-containing protein 1-like protein n=1 Tax=Dendrobium catenatum TaxID=906689 RepID=A0A2I0X7X8_9ASPA|nr:G patch domain and ankyrin repeat-containing protein 1 homolog [Dendrobium catenatum]PKU84023.1 SURP and G-patch domain-containing protein 1-like protein [Dendrobium catenatum]
MESKYSPLDSSNIGFQLLRKSGWKEGTGLGASEQGRLEPIQTQIKKNKCGIGAQMKKKSSTEHVADTRKENSEKRPKAISKRLRKMLQEEQRMKEKEFDQAFFRDFWPDNV